jgi:hypothetical protein
MLGPGGGTIFYDAGSTQSWGRYLEAAPSTWYGTYETSTIAVFCSVGGTAFNSYIGATADGYGDGLADTKAFYDNATTNKCTGGAIYEARTYNGGGKTDWYLPDDKELVEMWGQRANLNMPYISTLWGYWGSNEVDLVGNIGSLVIYSTTGANAGATSKPEATHNMVRPIRAFSFSPGPAVGVSLTSTGSGYAFSHNGTLQLRATLSTGDGLVTFYYSGKKIFHCVNVQSVCSVATCSWKPSVHGTVPITASATPSGGTSSPGTSSAYYIMIKPRTTAHGV